MPLLDVQRRYRLLGRIRLGQKGAKGQPQKLDTFRLTSPKEDYLEAAAALYGGTVQPWEDAPTGDQYELVTDTNQLDVLVPPQRITDSQSYALWTAGGLQRRCDGSTQTNGDECVCDATDRECKPVTHLQVMLPQLPDSGVWRLTTTGFNAAAELPETVDLLVALSAAGRPLPAVLMIEHRTAKVKGTPHHFIVPTLGFTESIDELEVLQGLEPGTLRAILARGPDRATAAAGRPVLPTERAALPAEPAPIPTPDDSAAGGFRVPIPEDPVARDRIGLPDDSVEPAADAKAQYPATDVPAADPPDAPDQAGASAAEEPRVPEDGPPPTAAEIRADHMAIRPSEALQRAKQLLQHRTPLPNNMTYHQVWVRRLFYSMERAGLWRAAGGERDGMTVMVDPLHMALWNHRDGDNEPLRAEHLADLRRDDLLTFCDQAADAAEAKLKETE